MPRAHVSDLTLVPGAGSYRPVYREGRANHCPGCHRAQWLVGRFSAECAFCGTALPLKQGSIRRAYPQRERPAFFTRGS